MTSKSEMKRKNALAGKPMDEGLSPSKKAACRRCGAMNEATRIACIECDQPFSNTDSCQKREKVADIPAESVKTNTAISRLSELQAAFDNECAIELHELSCLLIEENKRLRGALQRIVDTRGIGVINSPLRIASEALADSSGQEEIK